MKSINYSPLEGNATSRITKILSVQVILSLFVLLSLQQINSFLSNSLMGDAVSISLSQKSDKPPNELRSETLLRDTRKCEIAVGLGSDLKGERGQFALINSIIQNYDDPRVLCIFSFSTEGDFPDHMKHLDCVFDDLPQNVRIIVNKIDKKETWEPRLFSENGSGRAELNSEYNWFRWYLKPKDIHGMKRLIWLDTDIIVQGNVAELYDWKLNGQVAAAVSYPEPMFVSLCKNNPALNDMVVTYQGKEMKPQDLPRHLNAGMLLLDLEQFDKQGILKEWNRLLKKHEKQCLWHLSNQPPFTLAIRNKYEELPEVWNIGCMGCTKNMRKYRGDACKDGKILHWNGPMKPWMKDTKFENDEEPGCPSRFDKYDILSKKTKDKCIVKVEKS